MQFTFRLSGLWLPLITPFRNGEVDFQSLKMLVRHYAGQPLDGLVLAGTTGEAMTLDDDEIERIVHAVRDELAACGRPLPVILGVSGSNTRQVVEDVRRTSLWPVDGYLVSVPYYTRPSQDGLVGHFEQVADATDRPIVVYNIPYRTGVNLTNDSLLRIARRPNVIGLKDCCGDPAQSFDLFKRKPEGFAIMTGEDASVLPAICLGAEGSILSAAHLRTADFARCITLLEKGELAEARAVWCGLHDMIQLLFAEPSPAAVKRLLWLEGLIESPELRAPLTPVSNGLAERLDRLWSEKNRDAIRSTYPTSAASCLSNAPAAPRLPDAASRGTGRRASPISV